jgi:hypothetical protein
MKIKTYIITIIIASGIILSLVFAVMLTGLISNNRYLRLKNSLPSDNVIKLLNGRIDIRDNYLKEIQVYLNTHIILKKKHPDIFDIIEDWKRTKENEKLLDRAKDE